MDISVSKVRGTVEVTVFRLKGDLTREEPLVSMARDALAGGTRNLLLDLTDVPYMSSYGLRALHEVFALFRATAPGQSDESMKAGIAAGTYKSSHFKLLKPSSASLKALRTAGFDMFLEIHDSYQSAIASF